MRAMDLGVSQGQIGQFCSRWKIHHLAVFGSAVRGTLRPDSDIDLLVTFAPDADWTMFDHFVMEDELSHLFGREVDLVSIRAVEENPNPKFRSEIMGSARQIYAA
ncbi:MAG TPA: nucleotidyltransferase family protein [Sedimentisphaerales bacterium]|jgi:predicted nucleotidyltransferase|nr:nucleotidyltransferase family protein [Sedimentisphaerales bacterium]HNU28339.1 nucleotidyltransferase family protein [Sedimentisphaerales bacterium]